VGHDLVVLGDLVADLIIPIERLPLLPERHGWAEGIFLEPGGAGNVLVAARRIGLSVASLGHLGGDRHGGELRAILEREGVDMAHAAHCKDRSTVVCIVLADTLGQHVYLGIKDDKGLWPFPADWHGVIQAAGALYTDGYTLRDLLAPADVLAALSTALGAGVPVFFDPGPSVEFIPRATLEDVIAAADVLLIAEPEARFVTGMADRQAMARALLAVGPATVVLKLGADGCLVATTDGIDALPGFAVPVVDTVGAGDAFAAAFIAGWLRGGMPRACGMLANAMGALVATQRGAGTRIPGVARLTELLEDHPEAGALVVVNPHPSPLPSRERVC
jgi:sugar/nucleoside kinase (ribokinase family)